jgi:hypothetical protein
VAILFGLALLPFLLLMGGAIDYKMISLRRFALSQAADGGLLTGMQVARTELKQGVANWNADAVGLSQIRFADNAAKVPGASAASATTNIALSGSMLTGTINWAVSTPTVFLQMLGIQNITLTGSASAAVSVAQYTDIHFMVDVSGSMGIGADANDQQVLKNAIGCQIACHYSDVYGTQDNLAAARASGAKLRIDVVKSALSAALSKIPTDGTTRVAIYTFSNSLKTLFPLSSDIAGAITAVKALDITGDSEQGGTNTSYALSQLGSLLSTAGDGLTAGNPRGIVMLATDGVQDDEILLYANGVSPPMNWSNDGNFEVDSVSMRDNFGVTFESINASSCSPIKSKGYTMFTLETKYVSPTDVDWSYVERQNYIQNTLAPLITSNLSSCATSPTNYFQANSSGQIAAAISNMFAATISLRLTK